MNIYYKGEKMSNADLSMKIKTENFGGLGILIQTPDKDGENYTIPPSEQRGGTFGNFCKSYILNVVYKFSQNRDDDHILLAYRMGNRSTCPSSEFKEVLDQFISRFNEGMKKMVSNYSPIELVYRIASSYPTWILKIPYSVYRKPFLIDSISACIRMIGTVSERDGDIINKVSHMEGVDIEKMNMIFNGNIEYSKLMDTTQYTDQAEIHEQGGHRSTALKPRKKKGKFRPGQSKKLPIIRRGDRVKILAPHDSLPSDIIPKEGKVKVKKYSNIGVDFKEMLGFTNNLNGTLPRRTGYWIPRNKLEKVS